MSFPSEIEQKAQELAKARTRASKLRETANCLERQAQEAESEVWILESQIKAITSSYVRELVESATP